MLHHKSRHLQKQPDSKKALLTVPIFLPYSGGGSDGGSDGRSDRGSDGRSVEES